MHRIAVKRDKHPSLFDGVVLRSNGIMRYHISQKEHFGQVLCKGYCEIAAGFMRSFAYGKLTYDTVSDPNYCCCRVYDSDSSGFRFSAKNQTASSVAFGLPVNSKQFYKALSVDRWGNV